MNFIYAASEGTEREPMKNTWNEYDKYLEDTRYISYMMYAKSDSDYDSNEENETATVGPQRPGTPIEQVVVSNEEVRESPLSPPPRRREEGPVSDAGSSEREMFQYYAANNSQMQGLLGSSNRHNNVVRERKKRSTDARGDNLEAPTGVKGGPALASEHVAKLSVVTCAPFPVTSPMAVDSRTTDGLRLMTGLVLGATTTGCVTIGMVVPQGTPILELQGIYVKDFLTRERVARLNSVEIAKIITCGELDQNGILGVLCQVRPAHTVTGLAMMPRITEDVRVMTTSCSGKIIPTISQFPSCHRCDEKKME